MTLKHHNEKILGEILGIGNGMATPADESEDRPPINFAKLAQRFARRFFVCARIDAGENHAPARGGESIPAAMLVGDRVGVHSRPVSYLRNC